MVRIAVVSDTHGNLRLLADALSLARAGGRLDALIHLGDDHTDAEGMALDHEELLTVPGVQHPDYGRRGVPVSRTCRFGGVTLAMAHQPSDVPADAKPHGPRLVLHGHTHSLSLSAEPWGLRFNPGHLAGKTDRGRPYSFGVVEIGDEHIAIRAFSSGGAAVVESCWPLALLRRDTPP